MHDREGELLLQAAATGGWRLLRTSRSRNSLYLTLRHPRRGGVTVRISNHAPRRYVRGQRLLDVRVGRDKAVYRVRRYLLGVRRRRFR